jgi:hypothetical protein
MAIRWNHKLRKSRRTGHIGRRRAAILAVGNEANGRPKNFFHKAESAAGIIPMIPPRRAMRRLMGPKTVAELITSLVKTATLASKSDCQRMQYWQAIGAEYLVQIDKWLP